MMSRQTTEFEVRASFALKSDTQAFDASQVQSARAAMRANGSRFTGVTAALHAHPANVVRGILALDGVAKSVVLVPFTACDAFADQALKLCNPDVVVCDEYVSTDRWPAAIRAPISSLSVSPATGKLNDGVPFVATTWVLATSGTTGTPKFVAHTGATLSRTVSRSERASKYVWGLLYDPARFAGMQVVLQSMAAGSALVVPPPMIGLGAKIDYLIEHQVTALSATPTLWRNIMMTPNARGLRLEQITLGGEIADAQVLALLKRSFPDAQITHIYASTEVGVGFSVHDGNAGFPAEWLGTGAGGREWRLTAQGTLAVRLQGARPKYLHTSELPPSADQWFDTGDLVEIIDGRALFQGRLNGSINIGGNKVMPEEVEQIIGSHPSVAAVLVRAKKSSVAGALVEALVQLHPEVPESQHLEISRQIKVLCRDQLAVFKAPAFVKMVDKLPVSDNGKVMRNAT